MHVHTGNFRCYVQSGRDFDGWHGRAWIDLVFRPTILHKNPPIVRGPVATPHTFTWSVLKPGLQDSIFSNRGAAVAQR
jgi:hypothetical protein